MLPPKQKAVFDFIEQYQLEHGSSPTLKEIGAFIQVSSDNSVLKHLAALEKKGLIERDQTPRGIKILPSVKDRLTHSDVKLRLMGSIPAGPPTLTQESTDEWISVAENLVQYPHESFLLKVRGESMTGAGIYDGDTVIVRTNVVPHNNDIVVALIDGENTVKRYIYNGRVAYLKAENPDYPDIYPIHSLFVQGVVTGLMRTY